MKRFVKPLDRLRGLTDAISRYPLTTAFLLAAAVIVAVSINMSKDYAEQLLTCAVGAFLCAALQAVYERFFQKQSSRFILLGCGMVLTLGYYLIIRQAPAQSMEINIRTWVALLALYIAFIWVPVIRSRFSFNESFMAAFKAFFQSALYSAVIFGGCSLIIGATDLLIVNVDERAYSHTANIVFVLFAPIFLLSLIPVYPGKKDKDMDIEKSAARDEAVNRAAFCPKFLEILVSYIVIPLTAVFTVILVLYIGLNIGGAFWTDNLLEPMLVSYAVAVILVYILSSGMKNKFAALFRLIFPKVLVPVVLFQIVSSILSLSDTGITHTRYFVILFGIFAALAGIVMSIVPVRKNGIIAAMLIVFSLISIIPPVDAFTVSRRSQENLLKTVLLQNGMLKNDAVIPSGAVSDEDKKKITLSVEYLDRMQYINKIAWLPQNFSVYEDFYDTFGFYQYNLPENMNRPVNVYLNPAAAIGVAGYDVMTHAYINTVESAQARICDIENAGKIYALTREKTGDAVDIVLTDENGLEAIRFHTDEIFSRYRGYTAERSELSVEEATFFTENDRVKLTIVAQNANIEAFSNTNYYADVYILVRFK